MPASVPTPSPVCPATECQGARGSRGLRGYAHWVRASFEELSVLWEEGQRSLQAAEPRQRATLERVVDALVVELRRRIGGSFTADELALLYLEQGIDWCFDVATRVAPNDPAAWDLPTIAGAAYARFARRASDFGGGRRRAAEEDT